MTQSQSHAKELKCMSNERERNGLNATRNVNKKSNWFTQLHKHESKVVKDWLVNWLMVVFGLCSVHELLWQSRWDDSQLAGQLGGQGKESHATNPFVSASNRHVSMLAPIRQRQTEEFTLGRPPRCLFSFVLSTFGCLSVCCCLTIVVLVLFSWSPERRSQLPRWHEEGVRQLSTLLSEQMRTLDGPQSEWRVMSADLRSFNYTHRHTLHYFKCNPSLLWRL